MSGKTRWGVAGLSLVMAFAGSSANAMAGERADTDNTLGYYYWEGSGRGESPDYEFFEGFLTSDATICENAREVTIYRSRRGKDERIARVETVEGGDGTSRYFYIFPEESELAPEAKPGTYYSKPSSVPGCNAPGSNRVPVGPGAPAVVAISLKYGFAPGDEDDEDLEYLSGFLQTATPECGSDRKVTFYREEKGKDQRLGSIQAEGVFSNTYAFSYLFDDKRRGKRDASPGRYYAVPERVEGCQGPRSETVRVSRRGS